MQNKLILLRKEQKITQNELAQLLGITTKQYGSKELGKTRFNGDEMFKIAEYFNLKVDDIFLPTTHQKWWITIKRGIGETKWYLIIR